MPQLQVDFFIGEFVWLFVFFVSFYIYLKYKFLPKILGIYKVRSLLVQKLESEDDMLSNKKRDIAYKFFATSLNVYKESVVKISAKSL